MYVTEKLPNVLIAALFTSHTITHIGLLIRSTARFEGTQQVLCMSHKHVLRY